jgi:hypothetical protein
MQMGGGEEKLRLPYLSLIFIFLISNKHVQPIVYYSMKKSIIIPIDGGPMITVRR